MTTHASTLSVSMQSVAEAERMIEAKETLLAKWKEEAQGVRRHVLVHTYESHALHVGTNASSKIASKLERALLSCAPYLSRSVKPSSMKMCLWSRS
jgi:hypothetical protein